MPDAVPPWLATMQAITGTLEFPGAADNPIILAWRDEIARQFPEMASYCTNYQHDETPWCGLTVAYCMAHNGVRPVFGPDDTDKFLWAQAWKQFGTPVDRPQPGDVLVFARHVTLYDGEDGDSYLGRGGNQSDSVKVSRYSKSGCEAIRRPPGASAVSRPATGPVAIAAVKPCAGVTATVFGGQSDPNHSAYDEHFITDSETGVALPARFKGERPQVRVSRGDKSVVCEIVDVGPWYDGREGWPVDRYWETGARPRAESDGRTNGAGIDLTPAAARALGLGDKGKVDWEFVGAMPATAQRFADVQTRTNPFARLRHRVEQLEKKMTATTTPPATAPAPQQLDLARIEQDIARLGQIASTFSQFATSLSGQLPTTGVPPQVTRIEQDITRLGQIAGTFSQLAAGLPGQAAAGATPTPQLSPIDKALGGQALVGLKTPLAIVAYAGMWIMQTFGAVGTATGDKATTTGSVLTALIAAFGGLGVTAKFDRAFQAIGTVATVLQKLAAALPPPKTGTGG